MKILDLFSGLGGWSQAFRDRKHSVITVDIEQIFAPTICIDINDLTTGTVLPYGPFDLILASPPCNCFSVCTISKYWTKNKRPKNNHTKQAIHLIGHTINLIMDLMPRWWILENPRGMLRNVLGRPSATTYFAAWGHFAYKPTDLWGVLPAVKWRKPREWERAPRISQGKGIARRSLKPEERAKIPYALSMAICLACEKELEVA